MIFLTSTYALPGKNNKDGFPKKYIPESNI